MSEADHSDNQIRDHRVQDDQAEDRGPVTPPESDAATSQDTDSEPTPAKKATAKKTPAKKTAAKKTAAKKAPAKRTAAKKSPAKKATSKATEPVEPSGAAAAPAAEVESPSAEESATTRSGGGRKATAPAVVFQTPEKSSAPPRKRAAKKTGAPTTQDDDSTAVQPSDAGEQADVEPAPETGAGNRRTSRRGRTTGGDESGAAEGGADERADEHADKGTTGSGGQGADDSAGGSADEGAGGSADEGAGGSAGGSAGGGTRSRGKGRARTQSEDQPQDRAQGEDQSQDRSQDESTEAGDDSGDGGADGGGRRRRRRGGRRRRKSGGDGGNGGSGDSGSSEADSDKAGHGDQDGNGEGGSRRRRTRNRAPKNPEDEIASVTGSTRLEAKKQRRREGREAGRRRAPIVSEAEFLARREAVDRVMAIRQREDLTQIAVLEDNVLVEHYVARESQTSLIGNVYLGRVQNVLPSMEAAFVDIGKGRNAVLYAGEVNWRGLGHQDGQPRKIESVLSSGQTVLVQVTKDPVGHKGARLTGQISLPGRFLVYVPDGTTSGISRKLPDTERNRLKSLLKQIVPDSAGVIVRTAAEGASEDELTQDVERLTARWEDIEKKVQSGKGPQLLYGEPDLTLKVVRDLFTEDFSRLVVQGQDAWDLVDGYVSHVAPDLRERLERFEPANGQQDAFAAHRIDEQIAKALDRKVWLPSGGSLIIDRTEAMTVVDVNTGKFTGSGGNLEETVTKNNLEAAEEIVRQLRLRDIGGIIVIDFIDMVLESNRDLVLRRLVECLGRDRTRHQVAEVTSLGLVQMTRKRIGTGLVEAFSTECEHCKGRGIVLHDHPVENASGNGDDDHRGRRGRSGRGRSKPGSGNGSAPRPDTHTPPSPKDLAAIRPHPEPVEESPEQAAQAASEVAVEPPATTEAEEASAVVVEESSVEAESPEPQPVVVTSTRRRRSASRPAGPPVAEVPETVRGADAERATGDTTSPAVSGDDPDEEDRSEDTAEAGTAGAGTARDADSQAGDDEPKGAGEDEQEGDEPTLVHVPVKRKGRKH